MDIMLIVSGILGVILLIGLFVGLLRSWKKATIRLGLIAVCFIFALIFSSKLSELLMSKFVSGMVLSIFGQTIDFESIVGDIAGDLIEGSALTDFTTALLSICVKLISFMLIFLVLMIFTLIVYYIIVLIMSKAEKGKNIGKPKQKWWERLIGAGVGVVGSLLVCLALFTPVFGLMNVCDKFLEDSSKTATASAYVDNSFICGKFYTEDKNIGTVESYLEKYEKLRTDYRKSFAGVMLKCTGVDALGRVTFNKLSTVKQGTMKVNFTTECVNLVNVYNLYKENFVENKFDISTEQGVEAVQSIYNIAKNSEVLRSFVVELVPKMADKWTNGEKFMGMEIPVSGDMQEIVIELLGVFKTDDFDTIDSNINVLFEAIKVANANDVIKDINNGSDVMDVIDRGTFIEDELNVLSTTPEMKRALPNVLTTMVKIAYKSAIGDPNPEDKLDKEFTQDDITNIVWKNESSRMQTIVTKMFEVFDEEDILNSLTNIGEVIDTARQSIVSEPVQTLMYDFIDQKVNDIGENAKGVILSAISTNWGNPNYSYKSLFATVETTAKVAKDLESMELSDMASSIEDILTNSTDVKGTIESAIESGLIKELVGDNDKAEVYSDLITNVLNSSDDIDVSAELEAGQVIADIINKSSNEEGSASSMFTGTDEEKQNQAKDAVDALANSSAVMGMLETEANSNDSTVKEFIGKMNNDDKSAFEQAIKDSEDLDENTQETLAKLFGFSLTDQNS